MTEIEKELFKFCKTISKEGGIDLELTLHAKDGVYKAYMIRGYDVDVKSMMNCKGDRYLHCDLRTNEVKSGGWNEV